MSGEAGPGGAAWRCAVDAAFLDGATGDLRAALVRRHEQLAPARRARQRRSLPLIRWLGLGCATLGLLVGGYAVVVTPDAPCNEARLLGYHLALAFFAAAGTFFAFLPRVTAEVEAWVSRVVAGRAPRLLAPLRKRAPYTLEYALRGTRLETRAEKLKLRRITELRDFGAALVAPSLACLYRGRDSAWLRRVVYFSGAGARDAFVEALRGGGVQVTEVEGG